MNILIAKIPVISVAYWEQYYHEKNYSTAVTAQIRYAQMLGSISAPAGAGIKPATLPTHLKRKLHNKISILIFAGSSLPRAKPRGSTLAFIVGAAHPTKA